MAIVRIGVRVRPGTSRTRVGGSYGENGDLVVAVNAPPVDGAANSAVAAAVAKALGLRPSRVVVVSGHTARSKVLAVDVPDDDESRIRATVQELLKAGP